MKVHIRPETKEDIAKIWRINAAAFDTEAEANLVDNLREIGIKSEYDVPDEVFMVKELVTDILTGYTGVVKYHPLFNT